MLLYFSVLNFPFGSDLIFLAETPIFCLSLSMFLLFQTYL